MTLQELIDWAVANDVPMTAPIAIRHKDDVLLVAENLSTDDAPYFGNCQNGEKYLDSVSTYDEDSGERIGAPKFLMLGTGY